MTRDHSRVKQATEMVITQNPRFSAKPIVRIAAEMREALQGNTAVLSPLENRDDTY